MFDPPERGRPARILAGIHYLGAVDPDRFSAFFDASMKPAIAAGGAEPIGEFVTEQKANNFPALPVREGDRVLVWLAGVPDEAAERSLFARLRLLTGWRDSAPVEILPALMRKPEIFRLSPTPASALR